MQKHSVTSNQESITQRYNNETLSGQKYVDSCATRDGVPCDCDITLMNSLHSAGFRLSSRGTKVPTYFWPYSV